MEENNDNDDANYVVVSKEDFLSRKGTKLELKHYLICMMYPIHFVKCYRYEQTRLNDHVNTMM